MLPGQAATQLAHLTSWRSSVRQGKLQWASAQVEYFCSYLLWSCLSRRHRTQYCTAYWAVRTHKDNLAIAVYLQPSSHHRGLLSLPALLQTPPAALTPISSAQGHRHVLEA